MAQFRSGFVSIVGPANAGKSTLLNALLGRKVSIVSPRAQTTRNRILGVRTTADYQLVFLDSPGFLESRVRQTALSRALEQSLTEVGQEGDVRLLVVDGAELRRSSVEALAQAWKRRFDAPPSVVAINKIDLFSPPELLPLMKAIDDELRGEGEFDIVPVSALKRDGLELLERELVRRLAEGPRYFDENAVTDQSDEFLASEIIREKMFFELQEELPYSSAVRVELFEEAESLLRIGAVLLVERESQKGIVIGKGGGRLKEIGSRARVELEKIFGRKVYLELVVKVEPNWTKSERGLARAGMEDER